MTTDKDFYLNDRGLAAYLEKDWIDFVSTPPRFEFPWFDLTNLFANDHARLTAFLRDAVKRREFKPRNSLEVGASLGRMFYETCCAFPSLKSATLVEPSRNLHSTFHRIFGADLPVEFEILHGNGATQRVTLDPSRIRAACRHVEISSRQQAFQELASDATLYDLVICANVMDQCHEPRQLIDLLLRQTAPAGVLVLSCTYQWQNKYVGNAGDLIRDINDFFDEGWTRLGEINLPFHVRGTERYWKTFLSHAVVYQKKPVVRA